MQKMSEEEVFKRLKDEWDFEKLLEPYKNGGTVDRPVQRTWGTIIDWLMNKHKIPPDVIGAGIFLVWMQIKKAGHFTSDKDSYGNVIYDSAGNKFVHAIRITCASLMKQKMSEQIFTGMAGQVEQRIKDGFKDDIWINMPWFVKKFSKSYKGYKRWQAGLTVVVLIALLLAPWVYILNITEWVKKLI